MNTSIQHPTVRELTPEEYADMSNLLAVRFENSLNSGNSIPKLKIDHLSDMGIDIRCFRTTGALSNITYTDFDGDFIRAYSKPLTKGVYNVLKHFRNCASHSGRIKIVVADDGTKNYLFHDQYKRCGQTVTTMLAVINEGKLSQLINNMYNELNKQNQI